MNPNNPFSRGNIFYQFIRIRFLHSSASLSSLPPLPTTTATPPSSSYTVDFLVNSCGLSSKSALSVSKKFQLNDKKKTPQKVQFLIQFLKSHHFSETQVSQLIVRRPEVLNCKIDNNLKPKFEYLVNIGFEGELLPHIILSNPAIIVRSLVSRIKPSVEFLRMFLDSDEKFLMTVKRGPWLLSENSEIRLEQNLDVLIKEAGLPAHDVKKLLILQPRAIFQNPDKLISTVNSVKSLGFEPTDTMFIHIFRVMMQMNESTWKKKIEVLKSMGFSEDDTLTAFKGFPQFLAYSEENIRKTLNFYFNTMKLEPQTIITQTALIGYSIEKRVCPRYHVLKVLESKKLIKVTKRISHMRISEKNFRDKYLDEFIDEVPGLLEFYLAIKEGKSSVLDGEEVSFPLQLK